MNTIICIDMSIIPYICGLYAHRSQDRFVHMGFGSWVHRFSAADQAAKWDSAAWHSFPRPQGCVEVSEVMRVPLNHLFT